MTQSPDKNSHHKRENTRLPAHPLLTLLVKLVKRLTEKLRQSRRNAINTNTLNGLSDHYLKDIGLTRDELRGEFDQGLYDISSQRYYDIGYRQRRPDGSRRYGIFSQLKE